MKHALIIFITILSFKGFSQEEVDLLKSLRELKEDWWKIGKSGSGLERDLYTGLRIPFFGILSDREKALGVMQKSLDLVRKTLEDKDHPAVVRMADDLGKMEKGLSSFFPEEQE